MTDLNFGPAPPFVVVTDVDGTLVGRGERPGEDATQAAQALARHGATLVLASGRAPGSLLRLVDSLGVAAAIVASNGNHVQAFGGPGHMVRRFDVHVAQRALRAADESHAAFIAYMSDGYNYVLCRQPRVEEVLEFYGEPPRRQLARTELLRRVAELVHIHLVRPDGWSRNVDISGASTFSSVPEYMTITPLGVDKATGVRCLLSSLSLSPRYLFAIGDGENDIPLFTMNESIGLAVEGAAERLNAVAAAVSPASVGNGFAWAVRSVIIPILLGGEGQPHE